MANMNITKKNHVWLVDVAYLMGFSVLTFLIYYYQKLTFGCKCPIGDAKIKMALISYLVFQFSLIGCFFIKGNLYFYATLTGFSLFTPYVISIFFFRH